MRSETTNDMKDGELLEAFRALGDQDAFTALMRRHGQMVHGTARAMVGDDAVAEDVAQAGFLALARKAGMLEGADSVAGWLYHVALCLARNEYRAQIRRKAREEEAAMIVAEPDSGTMAEGVLSALYEELGNLAEKYRQPVILHHLEGLSYEAAAPMCGCTEKTFSVRLTRAREKLRERLARRGVALGAIALVAGLGQSASAAELPAGFVASTCAAAGGGAVSAQVSALMESALKMLFWAKVKTVTAVCAVAVLVGGAGVGAAVTIPRILHEEPKTAPQNEPLSAGDKWFRELLARAEAGAALEFGKCRATDTNAVWFVEKRTGASCLFWNAQVGEESQVLLDTSGAKRGVFVASLMIPPEGQLPPELAPPVEAKRIERLESDAPRAHIIKPGVVLTHRFDKNDSGRGVFAGSDVRILVPFNQRDVQRGVWYRCVVYVDAETKPGSLQFIWKAWLEDSERISVYGECDVCNRMPDNASSFDLLGLAARDVPVLARGVKFVPLGSDMPPFPNQKRD